MQIRKQLRKLSLTLDPFGVMACGCTPANRASACRDGYHGKHSRIRFKSRAESHGNATGQSKQKSK